MNNNLFKFYYRQYGVRKVVDLLSPRPTTLLYLPRNSLFHYYNSGDKKDIDVNLNFLANSKARCLVDFNTSYTEDIKGNPRKKPFMIRTVTREFFRNNKNYRYIPECYKTVNNPMVMMIINHSYLNEIYKYVEMPLTTYYRWYNTYDSIFTYANEIAKESTRQQFIYCKVPVNIPAFNIFELYMNRESVQLVTLFNTEDKFLMLELWKWMDPEYRTKSVFGRIDANKYSYINLIFKYDNAELVVNLGYLDSFIKGHANTTEFKTLMQISERNLKKMFFRFIINYSSLVKPTEVIDTSEADKSQDDSDIFGDDDLNESLSTNLTYLTEYNQVKSKEETKEEAPIDDTDDIDLESKLKDLDAELKSYDRLYDTKLLEDGVVLDEKGNIKETNAKVATKEVTVAELKEETFVAKSPVKQLEKNLDALVSSNVITVSEHRKFTKYIEEYNNSPFIYDEGKKTKDIIGYDVHDIEVGDTSVKASPLVLDKTMANVSIKQVNTKYLDTLYHKDIVNSIHNLQKANVIVKSHILEKESSSLGEYEHHTLELVPIAGAPSTVHFKLPVIAKDGTFYAGGNKYISRAQRVD